MMNESTTLAQVIKKRRNKLVIKKGYASLFIRLIVIAILIYLLFTQVFLLTRVTGNEMFPAIKDGDLIIGFRFQNSLEKNDVIIYNVDGEKRVGRYIAQQSDVVTIDDTGVLLVNGAIQTGDIMYPTFAKEGIEYPYTVPENHLFILGDHRTDTIDSRDFGSISKDDVVGKVITFLRRRGL